MVSETAVRRRRTAHLPRYLSKITLVLLEALGAGEPDLEELLDALEELYVVGAIVLGVRHPLAVGRGRPRPKLQKKNRARDYVIHVSRLPVSSISIVVHDHRS